MTRNVYGLMLLLAPLFLALAASLMHLYPFSARLLMFTAPALVIVAGSGAEAIWQATRPTAALLGALIIGLLFVHSAYSSAQHLRHPRTKEEVEVVLRYFQQQREPGDVFYLADGSEYAFQFYADEYGLADEPVITGASIGNWPEVLAELRQLHGQPRVWAAFLHVTTTDEREARITSYLDSRGTRLEVVRAPGVSAYLYDLTGATAAGCVPDP
jgi:hypothetical protein